MDTDSLPRNVAKWLILSAIDLKTTQFVRDAADNYTRFNRDSTAVNLGAGAVGMVVAHACMPVADKIVDTSANFIAEQRAKRSAKKNAKK
jgi:hypothetical protein